MKKQKKLLPIIALVFASVLWGVNIPLVKLGLRSIPITIFITVKFLAASLILLPFALKTWKPLSKVTWALIILSSLLTMTAGAVLLNVGLKYAPSINYGVIDLLAPLLLSILSVEFLKERMSLRSVVGVIIAFAGAAVIIGEPWQVSFNNQTVILGNILFFASMLSGVIADLIFKPILKKFSPYQITFLCLFIGTLPIIPFALMQLKTWSYHSITPDGYAALIYGIIAMPLANLFFYYGLKYKQVHRVAIFSYITPIVIVIAAWFILAERPSLKFILGAGLAFLGIYLAEFHKSQKAMTTRVSKIK
jgi:drug/metabolite transporter (DMT)-like permease